MSDYRPRCKEMGAAEGRQKIIKRNFVGQVFNIDRSSEPGLALPVCEIVRADTEVEKIARLYAVRIVVVILLAWKWPIAALWQYD